MADYGVISTGFAIKDFATILAELEQAARDRFGSDVDCSTISPTDPLGVMLGIHGERESAFWEYVQAVYDSRRASAAADAALDDVCALVGVYRQPATYSTVTATITGTPGTTVSLPFYMAVKGYGDKFSLVSAVTIAGGGTVDGAFVAQQSGPVRAPAGLLTDIVTPKSGVASITNALDAEIGSVAESDTALRLRRLVAIQAIGAGTVDAIAARIDQDVPEVSVVRVFENDTDYTDAYGLPPHSFQVVVQGGETSAIGNKIWEVKPAGIRAWGDSSKAGYETVALEDSFGNPHLVSFNEPDDVPIWFLIELGVTSEFTVGDRQITTFEVLTAQDGVVYTATINGIDFSATAGPSSTTTTLATALAAAINAGTGATYVPVVATPSAAVVSVTGGTVAGDEYPGYEFSLTVLNTGGTVRMSTANVQVATGNAKDVIDAVVAYANLHYNIFDQVNSASFYCPVMTVAGISTVVVKIKRDTGPATATTGISIGRTELATFHKWRIPVKVTVA